MTYASSQTYTVPCKKRNVPCKKRTVPFKKGSVPCKKRTEPYRASGVVARFRVCTCTHDCDVKFKRIFLHVWEDDLRTCLQNFQKSARPFWLFFLGGSFLLGLVISFFVFFVGDGDFSLNMNRVIVMFCPLLLSGNPI